MTQYDDARYETRVNGGVYRGSPSRPRRLPRSAALRRNHRPPRSPKLPIREALVLIRLIATRRVNVANLTRAARISRATVYRLLAACERDLKVRIECENGIFTLTDWGLLSPRKVLE